MGQSVFVATLTLMDGTAIKIPVSQITGYSSQYIYPTPGGAAVFKQSVIQLTNNQTVVVQEPATGVGSVEAAITAATDVGPP